MRITIVGAGNIGTQFATHCAQKGHSVTIFTSRPQEIDDELRIIDSQGTVLHKGSIAGATSDPQTAFEDADVVFVTVPAFCMQDIADKVLPYAHEGMTIGLIPGTGGGECAFANCITQGATIFGLQRVPSVARLVQYGSIVRATGYRQELFVGALPQNEACRCAELIESIFDIRCTPLPNYLNVTLTPSNPILHTTRLRTLFEDYMPGKVYDRVPLFYEDWTDESSELLLQCDDELQTLCHKLSGRFDLSYVRSLREHYESPTKEALTAKIKSIAGFKGLPSPVRQKLGGCVPDFTSRYFTADFSFGLSILTQIAAFAGVQVPNMQETLQWYHHAVGDTKDFHYAEYGITDGWQFDAFYMQ